MALCVKRTTSGHEHRVSSQIKEVRKKEGKEGSWEVASLDQRRYTPKTNGIIAFGKGDELRKRMFELPSNFGFQCI
jgi:hypothetical protein